MNHAIYKRILRSFFRDTAILLVIVLLYLLFRHTIQPRFSKTVYTMEGQHPFAFTFPLNIPSKTRTFIVDTHISIPPFFTRHFRFIPDDCLTNLIVNGKTFLLPEPMCLGEGAEIDLSDYLATGDNTLRITIEDSGGRGRLDIRPSVSNDFLTNIGGIILCVTIFLYGYLRLSLCQDTRAGHRRSSQ